MCRCSAWPVERLLPQRQRQCPLQMSLQQSMMLRYVSCARNDACYHARLPGDAVSDREGHCRAGVS